MSCYSSVTITFSTLLLVCCCVFLVAAEVPQAPVPPTSEYIHYSGRYSVVNGNVLYDWPGVQFSFYFNGSSCSLIFTEVTNDAGSWLNVFVDGNRVKVLTITKQTTTYQVVTGLPLTKTHHVVVTKRTEPTVGIVSFGGIVISSDGTIVPNKDSFSRKIEFVGDSITCGFGDLGQTPCDFSASTEDHYVTYGALTALHFGAEFFAEAWSGKGVVRNCCNQNITTPDPLPSYYLKAIANYPNNDWSFKKWTPDAVVINLGTNDYSTAPQPPQDIFVQGYNNLISVIRKNYAPANPQIFLVCGPMIGNPCCAYVQQIATANSATFINLQSILVNPTDYGCSGHPNESGHQKMAAKTIPVIESVMHW